MRLKITTLAIMFSAVLVLTGCPEPDDDFDSDSGSDGDSGGDSGGESYDALAGETETFFFTCEGSTSENSVEVVIGPCNSEQKRFSEVFGCNLVDEFESACRGLWSCAIANSSEDVIEANRYRERLDAC